MSPPEPRWQTAALAALVLMAVTLAVYLPACRNDFVNYDDDTYVRANPHVLGGPTRENIAWAFGTSYYAANWHPLTWLSLQVDAMLSPRDPHTGSPSARIFHLSNVLLHALASGLLSLALFVMTRRLWPGAVVAALFAFHPLHVESVAWVSERKDVLSGVFWMATLLAYAWYVERPGAARYGLVAVLLAFGLLAKPMLVTLPCVLLLLDFWPLRRLRWGPDLAGRRPAQERFAPASVTRLLGEKVPLLALAALSSVMTWHAQVKGEAMRSLDAVRWDVRAANIFLAYVGYLRKCFWPVDLAPYYPLQVSGRPGIEGVLAAVVLAAITFAVFWRRRSEPYLPVGWLWYLGTLVPVIGIVQVGLQAMADRYTYLPLVGIFIGITWAFSDAALRWHAERRALAIAGGVVIVLAALTVNQIGYWHDGVALWLHNIEVTPDNSIAFTNLAAAYALKDNIPEAIRYYETALQQNPDNALALANLGSIRARFGRYSEAESLFRRALAAEPRNPMTHSALAAVLFIENRLPEAEQEFRAAIRAESEPIDPRPRYQFGLVLIRQERNREAAEVLAEAVRLGAKDISFRDALPRCHAALAFALHQAGEVGAAAAEYKAASSLYPYWMASANAQAWQQATASDNRARDGRRALELALQINQATGFAQPTFLRTLAAAYAELGRFKEAIETVDSARRLAGDQPQLALLLLRDLSIYRHGARLYERGEVR